MTVLRSGSATDVGRVRKINQDLPLEAPNLYAVADGMGGHVGGEVAARVAIEALRTTFTREPTTDGLLGAFSEANRAVWQESQDQSDLHGMGTTLTAVALVGGADGRDMLALANVGDSRAYVFSQGQLTQVTADHSLAEERMRQGEMTEEEAAVHPQRHILTRALGVSPSVEADMWELQLRSGDRVVLCSDGLSNEVTSDELAEILSTQPDPQQAAQQMVELANGHGGADNITVVVVDVLVGEEGTLPASVVKPIGKRAGPPLIVAAGAAAAAAAGAAAAAAATPAAADTRSEAGTDNGTQADPITLAVPMVGPEAGSDTTDTTDHPEAGTGAGPDAQATLPLESPSAPPTDVLAPGAQVGFDSGTTRLSSDGPESGENFLSDPGPLARSTVRAAPPPVAPAAPPNETRRARRRRLGVPRRITLRVVLFVLLVLAIPVGAFFAIRWYAYDNWYPSVHGSEIVIQQGRSGGVLWFKPKLVNHTGVTTSEILPTALAQIHSGVQEASLKAAKKYVANAHQAYVFQHSGSATGGGSATVGPSGAIPTTTIPPSTTTTTVPPGNTGTTGNTGAAPPPVTASTVAP